jgi:Putative Ig domain
MSLTVWIQPSGSLGTYQENINLNLQLPVTNDSGVKYAVITGKLPAGLWLDKNQILGTPFEVARDTVSTFCIRASKDTQISDRTFSITITGPNAPVIITPPGLLNIGPYKQLYVIDDSAVNYQIEAIDTDTAAGQTLTYFISDGELPPGLSLSADGVIYGVVQSVTTLQPNEGNGTYDYGFYDTGPYDFASQQRQNGYDNLRYDYIGYDYYFIHQPRTLNRFYEFIVSVSDGQTIHPTSQSFQIYVVSADYFRADSESLVSNANLFTADVSYVQAPVWLTSTNLGTHRANNYLTVVLEVFDVNSVYFQIDSISNLPPGMSFDTITGDIYGRVPAQPAITKTYTFTVTAIRYGDPDTTELNQSARTFTIKIIGEVDSVITWNTPAILGNIDAGYQSYFYINAVSTIPNAIVSYTITSGKLPPGLTLSYDGEITGKVSQFSNRISFDNHTTVFDINASTYRITFDTNETYFDENLTSFNAATSSTTFNNSTIKYGIITFDLTLDSKTTFDNGATTIDHVYNFTVEANDQYYYSATSRTFTITVNIPNSIEYSDVHVRPYMDITHRATWSKFINDPSIFTPSSIYRAYDPAFGMQTNLEMLIYAGIETKELQAYNRLLLEKIKRFHFEHVYKATAYLPGTKTAVYEVLYVKMIDPQLEDTNYAIDNITQWRSQISEVGSSRWNYLPLWMRSVQPLARAELGFILSVPLCFCKVGTADNILLNIKHSNFDFKLLDYTVDRFTINKVNGYDADKYIIFNNRNLQ